MVGQNRTVYLVVGLSGAGKSFVCSQVAPYSYRIKFDRLRGTDKRRLALVQASQQARPIVADITKLVSTTITHNPEFTFKVIFVNEDLGVIRDRLEKRGGHFNEGAAVRRLQRLRLLSARYHAYSGTADECTQWLKHELRVAGGLGKSNQFYVYGIYELEPKTLRYIGKGHRDPDSGYDRVDHYDPQHLWSHRRSGVVFDNLRALVSSGRRYCVEIIEDGLTELEAFERERALIRENAKLGLWNQTDGGVVGWTLSAETRKKLSEARRGKKYGPRPESWRAALAAAARRRAADPAWRAAHSLALKGRTLTEDHKRAISAACKGKGRPKGWVITDEEARVLNLNSAGRVELTDSQKKQLRRYRYQHKDNPE
jgi:hypothetical protein